MQQLNIRIFCAEQLKNLLRLIRNNTPFRRVLLTIAVNCRES
jgi:hypothetical protein